MVNALLHSLKETALPLFAHNEASVVEVISKIELTHDLEYFINAVLKDKDNFIRLILTLIKKNKLRRIAIFPCNSYLEQILLLLNDFDISLFDDFRQGEMLANQCVSHTQELIPCEFDLILILSLTDEIKNKFMCHIDDTSNVLWFEDILKKHMIESGIFNLLSQKKYNFEKVDRILKLIKQSPKAIVSLNGFLFNNYGPTYNALKQFGYEPIIVCRNHHLLYAQPKSSIGDFCIANTFQLELLEIIYLCQNLPKCNVFVNDISFLIPSFDASKAKINFSFVLLLLKIITVPKFLYLYDVIHSVTKNQQDTEVYFQYYKNVIAHSDAVICNSNTPEVHNSIKYALNINKPMISFYRYNEFVPKLRKKIDDGSFHIVIIGGMGDTLRDTTFMLKTILSQKIHVHNYVHSNAIFELTKNLDASTKDFFHQHDSIVSQYALIEEISQYHAGWIVDNGFEVLHMINSVENKELKEMLMMFRLTTVSSSLLAMGSAGLPMFLNKMVVHVTYQFPKEFFIPIEEPEVESFSQIIADIDWKSLYKATIKHRKLFCIDFNIHQLIRWIESIHPK